VSGSQALWYDVLLWSPTNVMLNCTHNVMLCEIVQAAVYETSILQVTTNKSMMSLLKDKQNVNFHELYCTLLVIFNLCNNCVCFQRVMLDLLVPQKVLEQSLQKS